MAFPPALFGLFLDVGVGVARELGFWPYWPATAYCDGAFSTGRSPASMRFQSKKLEAAYRRVIKECDPESEVSCQCASLRTRMEARRHAEMALSLSVTTIGDLETPEYKREVNRFLNEINKLWVIVVIDSQNVFAYKRGSTPEQRECVIKRMRLEVERIVQENEEKFANCPCKCPEEKGSKCH